MAEDLDDDQAHQDILRQIRRLQNTLSSHAVSDYALEFAIEALDADEVTPATGPTQRRDLLIEAMQHLMWLVGAILLVAANFRRLLGHEDDSTETEALIDEVLVWTAYVEPTVMRRSENSGPE